MVNVPVDSSTVQVRLSPQGPDVSFSALAVIGMDLFLHCDFTSFAYAMTASIAAGTIVSHSFGDCKGCFLLFLWDL